MRIGIPSDPHLGFSRYSKVTNAGVNVREADFYAAFITAVENLMAADVDAILDLGDLADTPHPKKRALHILIETINASGLPWWSVNGNHTLVRHSTDIHLYDLLEKYCERFTGIRRAEYIEALDALLIPYGTSEEIKAGIGIHELVGTDMSFVGGHFACNDVLPDGHDITVGDLPDVRPIFLGHYHGRKADHVPTYIGATERKAWGEATNPTGCAIYDTDAKSLTFIDHKTRDWIDLTASAEDYQDVVDASLRDRDDQPIVRLTINATREEYRSVDELAAQRLAANALDLTIRRAATEEGAQRATEPVSFTLAQEWKKQAKEAQLPRGVKRGDVTQHGADALVAAGVAA